MFQPRFNISPTATRALMTIEASRQVLDTLPFTVEMLASLRETARLMTTHYSTQIEGNRLTQEQVKAVVEGKGRFPNRERDEQEVRYYYRALEYVEQAGQSPDPLDEQTLQTIHGLVMHGKPAPTPYRDGQNVIRDSGSGRIVYLPPEAPDVAVLMANLVEWINASLVEGVYPVPVIAAVAHYQFATIHPYYDGNGRTARLLTTLILHRNGYGLRGIYSLEAYYAQNLQAYYEALSVGESHNYYMGRAEADFSGFVTYFCQGMDTAFAKVRLQATQQEAQGKGDQSPLLRNLNAKQRLALIWFQQHRTATTQELSSQLGLNPRSVSALCKEWLESGFLELENPSRKARTYRLASIYEALLLS
ncbi:MAG: Fic family protein [Vampirovibrio sp.]